MEKEELKDLMKVWAEEDFEEDMVADSYDDGYYSFTHMLEIAESEGDIPNGTLENYGEECYEWYLDVIEELEGKSFIDLDDDEE